MSKHIDLLAVGTLLLGVAVAAHVHDAIRMGRTQRAQLLHIHAIDPVVIAPPHLPAVPRLPRLPHWPRV